MFRKLRNRFLIMNMLSTSAIVVVALAVIYTTSYQRMLSDNMDKLNSSANSFTLVNASEELGVSAGGFTVMQFSEGLPDYYSSSFQAILALGDNIHNINSLSAGNEDIGIDDYQQIVDLALRQMGDGNIIEYKDRLWQFSDRKYIDLPDPIDPFSQQPVIVNTNVYSSISFLDVTDSYADMRRQLWLLVGVGAGMLVVVFFISLKVSNRAISPIQLAWVRQKQFVADASHELKTPIAIIDANAEAMLSRGQDTVLKQRKWLDYIREQTSRMGGLVESMLQLASVESGLPAQASAEVDFSATVEHVLLTMEAMIFEKGLQLRSDIKPGLVVVGEGEQLMRLVQILLDNAVKYTPPGGSIDIKVRSDRRNALLTVRNTGQGIPEYDLPRLFDRFYRVDQSRVRGEDETGGFGLGLSLAKAIADWHNGGITAHSKQGEYTEFRVYLPTKPARAGGVLAHH